MLLIQRHLLLSYSPSPEPVILNVYGAQESIPRNEFHQPSSLAGRYDNPIPPRFLAPIDSLKIPALSKNLSTVTVQPTLQYAIRVGAPEITILQQLRVSVQ